MTEYIIKVDENDERWHYVERQYTHFFGYPIVEEIVRCRDCKHWMDYEHEFEPNLGYCREFDREEVRDSWFCAWGEKRDE